MDNGVNPYSGTPNYTTSTSLGARVARLNPSWNEDDSAAVRNANFKLAMALTLREMTDYVQGLAQWWWPGRSIVETSLDAAESVHAGGEIVALDGGYAPWKDHLADLEREKGIHGRTKFVLYSEGPGGNWRIQTVPLADAGFENRLPIEPAWWGVRDDALSDLSGVQGCVFVHANGFIGGAKTREGVLALAQKTLSLQRERNGGA